jgi:uncharacterized protein YjlB
VYRESHFHSTTHEVLCISSGKAMLCKCNQQSHRKTALKQKQGINKRIGFGGESNPQRVEIIVSKGDMIIIPAGVAHRLLDDFGSGFQMIGSYPPGYNWDMCYGKPKEEEKIKSISELSWFEKDPLYGDDGPVLE